MGILSLVLAERLGLCVTGPPDAGMEATGLVARRPGECPGLSVCTGSNPARATRRLPHGQPRAFGPVAPLALSFGSARA
ncbi:hypothetical protein ACE1SV_05740 [Streptomyces sennicomposti]